MSDSELKIHLINSNEHIDQYTRQTTGAIGYDLACAERAVIGQGDNVLIRTGTKLGRPLPEGVVLGILPRSSLFRRHGLVLTNSLGIIDQDYTEEILISVYKINEGFTTIIPGERVAQAVFFKIALPKIVFINEQTEMNKREGFGSTGA